MSTALRDGVQRLELTSRVTIGVLALGSGVYTYLGVRELLNGNSTVAVFAAVVYSVAVTIGIFAFWSFLMRLLPHVLDGVGRALLLFVMVIGSLMIIAMSAWLNATAMAGAAALEQHLANTLQDYTRDLDQAHRYALSAQSLLPDIQMASARFGQLADGEKTGTLTGTAGSGTVVQLLRQMSNQLGTLSRTVEQSSGQVKALYDQGGQHLAKMRELVSSRDPISQRTDGFGTEATALLGVIASLQQTSVVSAVKRTADDLAAGFIAPAAGGRTADLAGRQTAVVSQVQQAVAAQSKALSAAADKILNDKPVEPARFVPLSPPEAILRYAGDFIPSWAGAISIDLLPAVLVIILAVAHAGIRREGTPVATLSSMSASDLITAIRLAREVEAEQDVARPRLPGAEARASAPTEQIRGPDESVKPRAIASARAGAQKD
jgi:hypothetical protein